MNNRRQALKTAAVLAVGLYAAIPGQAQQAKRVLILTPYLTAPITEMMVKQIAADGKQKGWDVSTIDTQGNMGQLVNRIDDAIISKPAALILVSVDTNQLKSSIAKAAAAGIPVFGCDTHYVEGMQSSASSNDREMSKVVSGQLFQAIGNKGKVVVLSYRAHPGVLARTLEFMDELKSHPQVQVLVERHVDVPGPIESARQQIENILLANPTKGSIAGVWAGFDAAAIGATQAIMAAGRTEIKVTGVDGEPQAVKLIHDGSPFIATMRQDFGRIAQTTFTQVTLVLNGKPVEGKQIDVPAILITKANAKP